MTDPVPGTGKLYYIEIPATDIAQSAAFYRDVFGWNIRARGDGATSFDDSAGNVSGTWTTDRPAADQPGFRIYLSVIDAIATSAAIEAAGGTIVEPADPSVVDIVGVFRDPAGNLLGIHQYNPDNASTEDASA